MMTETDWIHLVTRVVEIVGTAIIVVGSFGALGVFLTRMATAAVPRETLVAAFRSNLGRSILLGLEFLVAADIINTVAVEPTVQSLIVLAGIVLIRTFLSFSLEVEIEGRWPWQKRSGGSGGDDRHAADPDPDPACADGTRPVAERR
jgi:uncharacterized membrane protein